MNYPVAMGRYQLLEPLAKGGMAELFKARLDGARGTEKLICIKRILPELSASAQFVELFVREAQIALSLAHGNIVQVFDFGEVDARYFLAMEYVHGPNLDQLLDRLREGGRLLPLAAALYITTEICRGLDYAHGFTTPQGEQHIVVHRDISPHNILLSYNGQVKLADFGIAATKRGLPDLDAAVRGKPSYLAPEMIRGQLADPRSDLFSLGAVLYELLTGVRAFSGATTAEILDRLQHHSPAAASSITDRVTPEIDGIVAKALAKDPDERYQTAADLLVDLSRAIHHTDANFTAKNLATLTSELFAWEAGEGDGRAVRDRLLFQLARAGVSDASKQSTSALLNLATVDISNPAAAASPSPIERATPPKKRPAARSSWYLAVPLIVVVSVGLLLFYLLGRPKEKRPSTTIETPTTLSWNPTDHLTPPSLRGLTTEAKTDAPPKQSKHRPIQTVERRGKRRRPRERPALQAAVEQKAKKAFLNCNSWPWSVVYLDGKRLPGNTPLFRIPVEAGQHTLRFVHPELGMLKESVVEIAAGETKTVAVTLRE
ncbi:MAG: serine/threonine protein kinase [Deltaproteobacteria bacterium]|nr:serine/threonine protein kinase [Deltaproteobacteria bacterium]